MRIAIIGGGWLGCHIASKLKQSKHTVTLFEQSEIFTGSSFYNQNRLHRGFHYSRNQKTRKLCYDTFNLFIDEYRALVEDIDNNYYSIPTDNSIIDYGTFKTIFQSEKVPFKECTVDYLVNIEGSILVEEKYINPVKAQTYFRNLLSDILVVRTITLQELQSISAEYDYVVNVTNNILRTISDCYYELSMTLVYNKLSSKSFGSITMVDGPLFSIYPYNNTQFTVTDVEYTPIFTSYDIAQIEQYRLVKLTSVEVNNLRQKIESKIGYYYKDFNKEFEYSHYYTSIKVKRISASADRYPIIKKDGNIISCVSGKIQGIYVLENYINNEIASR